MIFQRLVESLRAHAKTVTIVESSCGGLISASIMGIPGSSAVYPGGTVAYDTKSAKGLLLDDAKLHESLLQRGEYVESKKRWTALTAAAYCSKLGTSFALAEAGAAGPTFRTEITRGFSVLCVADKDGVLTQRVVQSTHNDRQANMRLFADAAAQLLLEVIEHVERRHGEGEPRYVAVGKNKVRLIDGRLGHFETDIQNRTTYLGLNAGKPWYCVESSAQDLVDLRTQLPTLPALDRRLALQAVALSNWQRSSRFCGRCGTRNVLDDKGHKRTCPNCGTVEFPRQDPSIIVAVSSRCGDKILLGRSPRHPERLFSTLAGFVEAGESFEDAVAREVFEETGVRIDSGLRYVASQPWPFPRSTMVAFMGVADSEAPLDVDANELEAAAWFDRADVQRAADVSTGAVMDPTTAAQLLEAHPDVPLLVPPPGVVARTLIDTFLLKQ